MADDLDAEFALFEQEIGGLEDEGTGEAGGEVPSSKGAVEALADSSIKDTADPNKSERFSGVKRSVQTVYSSAPVTSAQEEEPQQVILELPFLYCQNRMDLVFTAGTASSYARTTAHQPVSGRTYDERYTCGAQCIPSSES
jgi:hypothetical protein